MDTIGSAQVKKLLSKGFFSLYVFLYLYMPLIFQINILHILTLIAIVGIFSNDNGTKAKRIIESSEAKLSILFYCSSLMVLSIMLLFTSKDFSGLYSYIMLLVETLPCALFISTILINRGYQYCQIIKFLVGLGVAQSIIALIMYAFPDIKAIIFNYFISNGLSDDMVTLYKNRGFGVSANYNFGLGVVQGIIAALSVWCALNVTWSYIVYTPILLFSCLINARIGFVVFLITIIIMSASAIIRGKIIIFNKLLLIIIVTVALLVAALPLAFKASPQTIIWIIDGVGEIAGLVNPKYKASSYSTVDTLKSMNILPQGVTLFSGLGVRVYGDIRRMIVGGKGSDVGYINDLFYGGLFFSLLLYMSMLLISLYSIKKDKNKEVTLCFVAALVILNVKWFVIGLNEIMNLYILHSMLVIGLRRKYEFDVKIKEEGVAIKATIRELNH